MSDPRLVEAARDMDSILRSLEYWYANGISDISRLADVSESTGLVTRLDQFYTSARSKLCGMDTLVGNLESEASRSREVAS